MLNADEAEERGLGAARGCLVAVVPSLLFAVFVAWLAFA